MRLSVVRLLESTALSVVVPKVVFVGIAGAIQ